MEKRLEYPQFCHSCHKELILRQTVSTKRWWRKGVCDECKKLIKRSQQLPNPKKLKLRNVKDSIPQRILFEELKRRLNPKYLKYNFPVRTWVVRNGKTIWNIRYIDIAYTVLKIAYEYDGEQWHKKPDKGRDNELKRSGWKVIHINKHNIQRILDLIKSD